MAKEMLSRKNKSLKGRLLLSIVTVMTVTVVVSFGLFFYHSYKSQYERLHLVGERTASINALTISAFVKNADSKHIRKILNILKENPNFSTITVTDTNNNIIASASSSPLKHKSGIWGMLFKDKSESIVRPIIHKGREIGRFTVELCFDHLAQNLQRSLTFALGLFACMLFLVIFTVYYEILRLVLAPLNKIIRAIQEMARGDLNVRVEQKTNDELGLLADSFNKMSHDLKSMYEIIEEKVRQRTKELQETQTKQQASEAANKAKSQFLANMSHELRTPLNAIIGYSDILMEDALEEERQDVYEDLKRIHTAGNHLLGLVNDILDISKIESGKVDLHLEDFKVQDILDEINQLAEPLMEKNENTFEFRVVGEIPEMHSDYTKVKQILTNLIGNSSKFTHKGTVTLEASSAFLGDVEAVEFKIIDTGIGMNEEQLQKVFQNFTQADESTSRKYGGTGLGLAITKNFTTLLKGDIKVESEMGKGTTFIVTLPVIAHKENRKSA